MKVLVASPAYGRQYQSIHTIKHAWKDGKDFKIDGGPYFSVRDLPELAKQGYDRVIIQSGEHIHTVEVTEVTA